MRQWSIRLAIVAGAALTVGAFWLLALNGTLTRDPFVGLTIATVATYTGMGALLWIRVPSNRIGPLFLGVGLGLLSGGFASEYATYGLATNPGALPHAMVAAWFSSWLFIVIGGVPLLLVWFPTGRVPSSGWRWVPVTVVASMILFGLAIALRPGPIEVTDGVSPANPIGIEALGGVLDVAVWVAGFGLLAGSIGSVAALVTRRRAAEGEERQQVRWLASVAVVTGIALLASVLTAIGLGPNETTPVNEVANFVFFICLAFGIPAAVTIALLKYRLYDLDIVIKKTALYVTVAGLLLVAFLAIGAVIGAIFGRTERAAVIVAAVIGLAFWPAVRYARRIADRIVYGGRATPYEVLASFGKRMSETYATDDVLGRTAQLLGTATGASSAVVWLRVGRELRAAAGWPANDLGAATIAMNHDELPQLPADWAEPVLDRGELLGALAVTMPANDPIGPGRQQLMRDLAAQAGLALRNVRLIEELRASRQRLVAAQDEERRRLERNIHDGVQQQLVALAVKLRLADMLVDRDPLRAHEQLTSLQDDAGAALEDLRDLARGIYPPLLADKGLRAALDAQASRAAVPIAIDADGIGRYPRDLEATVYFCALEALNNVAKYADATAVSVRLVHDDEALTFTVTDDGRGFDQDAVMYGTGLQGMSDRIEAVGGSLAVRSAPGRGTTVTGSIPVPSDQAVAASHADSNRSGPNDDFGM
jgi:signal transduction histidine kinase